MAQAKRKPVKRKPIKIKKSKVGSLRRATKTKKGKNIPAKKLRDKPGDSKAMKKKKHFARQSRKWNKN